MRSRAIIRNVARNGLVPAGRLIRNGAAHHLSADGPDHMHLPVNQRVCTYIINPPLDREAPNFRYLPLSDTVYMEYPIDMNKMVSMGAVLDQVKDFLLNGEMTPRYGVFVSDLFQRSFQRSFIEDKCFKYPHFNFMQTAYEREVRIRPSTEEAAQRLRRNFLCLTDIAGVNFLEFMGIEVTVSELPLKNIRYVLAPAEVYSLVEEGFRGTGVEVIEVKNLKQVELRLAPHPSMASEAIIAHFSIPDYAQKIFDIVRRDPDIVLGHLVRLSTDFDV